MQLPPEINDLLNAWNTSSMLFLYGGYALVAVSILASLAVTTFADHLSAIRIKALGFVAAACTGLLAAGHPIEVGNGFRDGWRILKAAALEYQLRDVQPDKQKLVAAARSGEEVIARAQGVLQKSSLAGLEQPAPVLPK